MSPVTSLYRRHFRSYAANLRSSFRGSSGQRNRLRRPEELGNPLFRFAVQPEPDGYGHAVWCAREFAAGGSVLLLLGDHPGVSGEKTPLRPANGSSWPRARGAPCRPFRRRANT
ncbi:MAG: hypothetical protein U0835_10375 [Isosphaeraceae bacterium]